MKRNVVVCGLVVSLAACWLAGAVVAEDKEAAKVTIKDVMKLHKEKLQDKAFTDKAAKEKLIEAYTAIGKLKPPKGDEKAWKEKTDALVKALKDDDKDGFKKAVDCGACHKDFKK